MRGKAQPGDVPDHRAGITPAHAGKRNAKRKAGTKNEDHPRPCGEKVARSATQLAVGGSPPPMRGKVLAVSLAELEERITPAHAGKRDNVVTAAKLQRDHPRPCGEK